MSLPPATVRTILRKINLSRNSDEMVEEDVAVDSPIEILLNGKSIVTLLATPLHVEELATGFLVDEGIVERWADLVSVRAFGKSVIVEARGISDDENVRNLGIVLTSCGASGYIKSGKGVGWPSVHSDLRVRAYDVSQMISKLSQCSTQFPRTGTVHSAAIFHENVMKTSAEDVGRHNAIDKVIGSSLKQGLDLARVVLVSTGRQPADLVLKAARVGIPITVSMRGPIHSGVVAAETVGMTLVCFARGPRMNVYTHPERIVS